FLHDGRVDSLTRFLRQGLGLTDNQQIADMTALLFSFSGKGAGTGSDGDHDSKDVPAGVGRQLTLTAPAMNDVLERMLYLTDPSFSYESAVRGIDLVARGVQNGLNRGWFFNHVTQRFQSDRNNEDISISNLLALTVEAPVIFTAVAAGTGTRV